VEYGFVTMADGSQRKVSRLVLGAARFGGEVMEDTAFRLMDRYFERGGNALDTARVYGQWLPGGKGTSECTVGRWIRSRGVEKEIFLITKGGHPPLSDLHMSRLSPEEVQSDMEMSLEALGVSAVDLYFLHRDDVRLPVTGIMDTLHELAAAGKARSIGASNWRVRRIKEANAYALAQGKTPFTATQIQWSYGDFSRAVGDDTLVGMDDGEMQGYRQMNLSVMAYSSQAGGVFFCGYKPDLSDAAPKHMPYVTEENIRRYGELLNRCRKERGMTPERVVLEHITHHPLLSGYALIGPSRMEQLDQALAAANPMEKEA